MSASLYIYKLCRDDIEELDILVTMFKYRILNIDSDVINKHNIYYKDRINKSSQNFKDYR